jgi:PAS domain S-box-containing protein
MEQLFELIAAGATALSATAGIVFWIYRKIIKRLAAWGDKMTEAAEQIKDLKPIVEKHTSVLDSIVPKVEANANHLEMIVAELKFNSGSTLRDMVSDIHSRVMLAEQFDKALADSLPYAVWHTNDDGDWIWVNRVWENMTSISKERSRGRGWIAAIHVDDRKATVTEWYRAVKDHRDFVMCARIVDISNGITVPVHIQAFMLKNDRGEYLGHIGMASPQSVPCQP